ELRNNMHGTLRTYRERAIAYVLGGIIYLGAAAFHDHPIGIALRPAVGNWIVMGIIVNAWMHLIEIWRDPITHRLGISNRVHEIIFVLLGLTIICTATFRPSPDLGTWGCLSLLF